MKRWALVGLLAVAGCGATGSSPGTSDDNDDVGVVGNDETEDAMSQLLPESEVLSWGTFVGAESTQYVDSSGGPWQIRSIVRVDTGHYLIEYDISSNPLPGPLPAIVANAGIADVLNDTPNIAVIVSAGIAPAEHLSEYFTLEVIVVASIINDDGSVLFFPSDVYFSVVLIGDAT